MNPYSSAITKNHFWNLSAETHNHEIKSLSIVHIIIFWKRNPARPHCMLPTISSVVVTVFLMSLVFSYIFHLQKPQQNIDWKQDQEASYCSNRIMKQSDFGSNAEYLYSGFSYGVKEYWKDTVHSPEKKSSWKYLSHKAMPVWMINLP